MNWIFSSYFYNDVNIELDNLKKLNLNDNDNILITNKQLILKRHKSFFKKHNFNYYYFQRYDKKKSLALNCEIYHGEDHYLKNFQYIKHYYIKYEDDIREFYSLNNNVLEKTRDFDFNINIDTFPSTGFICFRYCQELLNGQINLVNFTGIGNPKSPHTLKNELKIMSNYCNLYSI